jgi:hypothetical protein
MKAFVLHTNLFKLSMTVIFDAILSTVNPCNI